ncbi:MAG: short-chain dehydrogenase [Thermoleophilia bacterium]|nr:short-chain dehydrogenase [Thermoleophilia bacterium]
METLDIADDGRPVVLVTGASSGIGRATAIEFARRRDAHLVLTARREHELRETSEATERARDRTTTGRAGTGDSAATVLCVACDLATADGIDTLVAAIRAKAGRLDVLVNNAGVGGDQSFDAPTTMRDADRMLALNLRAPIALCHELLPLLRASRGSIVNISSVAGLIGTPDSEVYSSTKWALTGFSEALRASQSRFDVHVACVHPGPVPTPGWPHARLARSRFGRRVLASNVEVIARTCERAARRRGGPAPVRPRTYAPIPLLRGLAPWSIRALLERAARTGMRARLHAPLEQEQTP